MIASSHPVCNTLMLLGVMTCLGAVVPLGLDGQFVSADAYPVVCQFRAWLLCIGFTLAYGAMFSKVWRVHRLHTKAKQDSKVIQLIKFKFVLEFSNIDLFSQSQNRQVEPWKLYLMVAAFLAVDGVLLVTWLLQDPLQRRVEVFPLEEPPSSIADDIKIRPELEHCESTNNNIWLGNFKNKLLSI